jgi:hypothetical protein
VLADEVSPDLRRRIDEQFGRHAGEPSLLADPPRLVVDHEHVEIAVRPGLAAHDAPGDDDPARRIRRASVRHELVHRLIHRRHAPCHLDEQTMLARSRQAARRGGALNLAAWRRVEGAWRLAVFVRIAAPKAPSPAPPDAGILAGEHGVAQPDDPEVLRLQVIATDMAFAAHSVTDGYTVAFTSYCAPDAVIAGGADLHWNAAGVAEALAGWTPGDTLDWKPLLGRAAASGDLGYTVGAAVHRVEGKPPTYTKYLTIWIRTPDGSWRFVLDGGNARPAPSMP